MPPAITGRAMATSVPKVSLLVAEAAPAPARRKIIAATSWRIEKPFVTGSFYPALRPGPNWELLRNIQALTYTSTRSVGPESSVPPMARTSMRSGATPSSISTWRMARARLSDSRRASEPLSPLVPPKACSSTRALGLVMEALRSPARNLIAPKAAFAGSGAFLANRITLRLVRLSLPVAGPAGAVLGGGGAALPNTLPRLAAPPNGFSLGAEGVGVRWGAARPWRPVSVWRARARHGLSRGGAGRAYAA